MTLSCLIGSQVGGGPKRDRHTMRRPNAADTRRYSTARLVLGLAFILLVLVLGAWFYRDQSEHLRSQAQVNIDAVGDLMAAEVLDGAPPVWPNSRSSTPDPFDRLHGQCAERRRSGDRARHERESWLVVMSDAKSSDRQASTTSGSYSAEWPLISARVASRP